VTPQSPTAYATITSHAQPATLATSTTPGTRHDRHLPVPPAIQPGLPAVAEWPLRTFLELGALPSAVACGRLHVRQVLWEWGLSGMSSTVELVATEVLTNAIAASGELARRPPIKLWLLSDKAQVTILVQDSNPRPPVRVDAEPQDEAGRGLLLVDSLSTRWGWCPGERGTKTVWAVIEEG
jgi:anti-sigma regulatory factor (Ser/Thr protein kinase)